MRNCMGTMALVVVLGLGSVAMAGDWYVDNQAAGAGDGTSWTDAFTNLSGAVSAVWGSGGHTGDTIYVRQAVAADNYLEAVVIGAGYADGSALAYNRIVGWTGSGYKPQPVIALDTAGANKQIITLGATGAPRSGYEFSNLAFAGSASTDYAVTLLDASSHVRFIGNTCQNAAFNAQTSDLANDNLLIQDNAITAMYCIMLQTDNHVQILGNTLTGSSTGVFGYLGGSDVLIRGNAIDAGDCIVAGRFANTVVERNRLRSTYRFAYREDRWGSGGAMIFNNIFHACTGSAEGYDGIGVDLHTPNARIFNNTFSDFPEAGARAISLSSEANNTTIFNNIVSGVATGVVNNAAGTVAAGYNDFWDVDTPYANVTSSGGDKMLDPRFANIAAHDYTIRQEELKFSAADTFAGVNAPTNDYSGSARSAGAISYGAVQGQPPIGMMIILR